MARKKSSRFVIVQAVVTAVLAHLHMASNGATSSCAFKRGDANGDGNVDVSDVPFLAEYLFQGGAAPPNLDGADFDDSGSLNITDVQNLAAYLFAGGDPPPAPGPTTQGCDPTPDTLEPCCTPAPGELTVGSGTAAPGSVSGYSAFDCNTSSGNADPRKISITSANSEDTEGACSGSEPTDELSGTPCCNRGHDPCNHASTRTRWKFTWALSSPNPCVERLAFNSGCVKLRLKLDYRAAFYTDGPCTKLSGACPTGTDILYWTPENTPVRFFFRNQTTNATFQQNLPFSAGTTWMTSAPAGGNPCSGLDVTISGTNSATKTLSSVDWTGDDPWKLERIEVDFLAIFYRSGDDNSDWEEIAPHAAGYSVYLENLAYQ